jgi:transposase InsO family protein
MKVSIYKGNSYENAHAESLFKTIKYQEINIFEYSNENDMTLKIFNYIRNYNERKPHSTLKGEFKRFIKWTIKHE